MNKTLVLVFIFVLAFAGGYYYLSSNSTPSNTPEITQKADSPTITFNPATLKLKVGESQTVALDLDPLSLPVVGLTLELIYDPTQIELISLTNSGAMPNTLASAKINNGVASISLATPPSSPGISSPTQVISLQIKALNSTSSTLSISPSSQLVSTTQDGNLLSSYATLQIN